MKLNINFDQKLEPIISSYQPLLDWFEKNQDMMAYFELTHAGCTHFENTMANYDVKVLGRLANACLSALDLPIENNEKAKIAVQKISDIYNQEKELLSEVAKDKFKVCLVNKNDEHVENEDIFVKQSNPFNANGPVYAFTNEALCQYMPNYDFTDKKVLASLGSGDFSLNAFLLGATKVDNFDINLYTQFFYQLKKALIIKYNYEEFISLIKNPVKIFEKYNEYSTLLDKDSKMFFDRLLKMFNGNYEELIEKMYIDKIGEKTEWNESNTFSNYEEFFLVSQYKNPYLESNNSYERLRDLLRKGTSENFLAVDLYKYSSEEKYDIIYLSNIGDYNKNPDEFRSFLDELQSRFLTENGVIIVVSITNHVYLDDNFAERTTIDWEPMREFNNSNKGRAELPICNLGIQNIYTTYPYQIKKSQTK